MSRRRILLPGLLLLVFCPTLARAQGRPVILQVNVYYEDDPQPVQDALTIQLMDGWGMIQVEQTTTHGIVQFRIESGIHRLRITGPTIDQFDTEFNIGEGESSRTERVQVRRKTTEYQLAMRGNAVPAVRLNIPPRAQEEFEKGARAIDKKKWQEAREFFSRAIELYADYDMAYNGRGVAELNSGDTEGARRDFEKAIRLNDNYADACRNLAKIQMSEHNYGDADATLKKALKSEPLAPWSLTYAAYAEFLTGKYDEAVANAQKAHSVPHAGFAGVHIVAARALEATHHPREALDEYRLYLKEDPQGRDAKSAHEAELRLAASKLPANP
jgi:hypothetical protein